MLKFLVKEKKVYSKYIMLITILVLSCIIGITSVLIANINFINREKLIEQNAIANNDLYKRQQMYTDFENEIQQELFKLKQVVSNQYQIDILNQVENRFLIELFKKLDDNVDPQIVYSYIDEFLSNEDNQNLLIELHTVFAEYGFDAPPLRIAVGAIIEGIILAIGGVFMASSKKSDRILKLIIDILVVVALALSIYFYVKYKSVDMLCILILMAVNNCFMIIYNAIGIVKQKKSKQQ